MTKLSVVLVLAVVFVSGSTAIEWKNLHLTFGLTDGMFQIPFTKTEIMKEDYSLMITDPVMKVDYYAYKKDPRVSIGFDQNGNIAGVRIAYIKSDIGTKAKENGLNFDMGYYNNDPMYQNGTFFDTKVYYNTILFTDPAVLKAGGRKGSAKILGDNVYIRINGVWTKMPKNECDAPAQNFAKEACFPAMGKHYFYGVTPDMDCKNFNGLFMMYEGGELIGLGITAYGSHTNAPTRTWYENPASNVYKAMVPNGAPECMTNWVDNYGATSLHFFFKKFPRLTFCLEKETQC